MDPKPTNNFVCKFKLSIVHASLSFNNNSGFKHPGVEWRDDRLGVGVPSHRWMCLSKRVRRRGERGLYISTTFPIKLFISHLFSRTHHFSLPQWKSTKWSPHEVAKCGVMTDWTNVELNAGLFNISNVKVLQ